MPGMWIKLIILAGVLLSSTSPAFSQLKKVRFSVAAPSIAEMPFRIAQTKGFYREEGLDVEVIFIRGAVGMQALLGGSVDFSSASGSTIAAAVRGIPVKLVFIASACLLAVVAAFSIYLPARRAARLDPIVALRSE